MSEKRAYRGYLICDNRDGQVWIEKGGTLIGYAHDHEDAVMKVDAMAAPVQAPERDRKRIDLVPGGWTNPDSDKPCGPSDPTLKSFDPVHVGSCRGCRAVVVAMLKERAPKAPSRKHEVQLDLF